MVFWKCLWVNDVVLREVVLQDILKRQLRGSLEYRLYERKILNVRWKA